MDRGDAMSHDPMTATCDLDWCRSEQVQWRVSVANQTTDSRELGE